MLQRKSEWTCLRAYVQAKQIRAAHSQSSLGTRVEKSRNLAKQNTATSTLRFTVILMLIHTQSCVSILSWNSRNWNLHSMTWQFLSSLHVLICSLLIRHLVLENWSMLGTHAACSKWTCKKEALKYNERYSLDWLKPWPALRLLASW